MRRYVLTGTPGSGKTSILRCLAELGYGVVEEAATAVIARAQALGEDEPWMRTTFVDDVVDLQRQRQLETSSTSSVQVFDRSPVCTYALANYLGLPASRALTAEIERITAEEIYERQVLFVLNLGFCEPTSAVGSAFSSRWFSKDSMSRATARSATNSSTSLLTALPAVSPRPARRSPDTHRGDGAPWCLSGQSEG
ncbi:AAA family ATPase [Streptomyces sp. NBC_01578]|uniref:AAA family ATPase n=1 Tax=Streptomyces sp. NBC_01578 TaxID=2975884 RepID=UPI00386D033C